jgi:hypothetical protein
MGPNAQLGGVQIGFAKEVYQVVNSEMVAKVPTDPAKNTTKMDPINLGMSLTLKPSTTYHLTCFEL